jgi:stress-induced morphogen
MPLYGPDRPPDDDVQAVLAVLNEYKASHPGSKVKSYRQNSTSIRIRIIDPSFRGMDRATRDDLIWHILGGLPERIQSQITVVLLLTPDETKSSFANMDFENPIPSRL